MTKYTSDSIETLRFPDSIRRNPSMYVGGTDAHGLFVILREPSDNAVDEHLAGRNDSVSIKVDTDGSYWVQDSGAGIPQGIKKIVINVNGKEIKSSMPTLQAVVGELHTSGKFHSEAYKVSMGTHGIGIKGTNALSEFFTVHTCYKGEWFEIGFKKGKLVTPVKSSKAPISPFTGKRVVKGTLIHFQPDASVFSVKSFPPAMLLEWAEIQAYLNPGLKVTVDVKGKTKTFFSKKGASELIHKWLAKEQDVAVEADAFIFNNELAHSTVMFSNVDGFKVKGYVNGLGNSQGGKHVDSVARALYEAIKPYMTGIKKVEGKPKYPFGIDDFKDGMIGVVNAKLHKAAFSSQDKAKLTDDRMGKDFEALVLPEAKKFFAANKAMAKRLCDRATKITELKGKFKASKAVATALNKMKRSGLPPKYAPPSRSVPPAQREIFIVEGDSAAGGIRKVRLPHQGLLPLKGKMMNAWRAKGDKALASFATMSLLAAMGFDPRHEDPLKKLQVGAVILLADADADGEHINCLLNALFSKYLPGMYEAGMIYVGDMPEFYAIKGDQLFTGDTLSSIQKKLKAAGVKAEVKHAKGWGEVDHQVLKILAVDAETRKLIRIKPLSKKDLSDFSALMGKSDPGEANQQEKE